MYQDYCIAKAKAEAFVEGVSDLDADLVADAVDQARADKQRREDKAAIRRTQDLLGRGGLLGSGRAMPEADMRQIHFKQMMAQRPAINPYGGYYGSLGGIFG